MKVGSICECIHNFETDPLRWAIDVSPKLKNNYTIRKLYSNIRGTFILLEEITAPHNMENGQECGFAIQCFREIQFPDDLQTEITEALTRPERKRISITTLDINSDIINERKEWR